MHVSLLVQLSSHCQHAIHVSHRQTTRHSWFQYYSYACRRRILQSSQQISSYCIQQCSTCIGLVRRERRSGLSWIWSNGGKLHPYADRYGTIQVKGEWLMYLIRYPRTCFPWYASFQTFIIGWSIQHFHLHDGSWRRWISKVSRCRGNQCIWSRLFIRANVGKEKVLLIMLLMLIAISQPW